MDMYVPGEKIAQIQQAEGSANLAYSATQNVEINRLVICNLTSTHSYAIYHSSGEGFSRGNALFYYREILPNDTHVLDSEHVGSGIQLSPGDRLGVACSADATFTFYGTSRASR